MEQKEPIKIESRIVIRRIMEFFLVVLALGTIIEHASADNKANRKHAIINVLGIIVLILLTLMDIGGAAQSSSDDLIKQGVELMNSRNPDNYTKAIEINQQDKVAWNNKGLAFCDLGKDDEALVIFVNATKIDPQYPNAWDNEGKTLDKLSKSDEARNAYKQADTLAGLWSLLKIWIKCSHS